MTGAVRPPAPALAANRPAVIDARVDPAIPLLPPGQPREKVQPRYAGPATENSGLAHLCRERADEGYDDPAS